MLRGYWPIYQRKEDRLIYVFVSPVDKVFFVHHCRKDALRETYRHHIHGRRYCTQRFMVAVQPHRPCAFVLEELSQITIAKAYRYILAWIKILMDHGYVCYNYPKIINQANAMLWETKLLYLQRKDFPLTELISCEKCPVRVYKKKECPFWKARELDE